jgi:hypothetical protein
LGALRTAFKLAQAKYDKRTQRGYVELKAEDDEGEHLQDDGIEPSCTGTTTEAPMGTPDENDDVTEANLSISRPEQSKSRRKERAERLLSIAMPPAAAGAAVAADENSSDTEKALKRATKRAP